MADQLLTFFNPDQLSEDELAIVRRRIAYSRNTPFLIGAGLSGGYFALNQFFLKRYFSIPFAVILGIGGYFTAYSTVGTSHMSSFSTFKNSFDESSKVPQKTQSYIANSNFDVLLAMNKRWCSYALTNNFLSKQTYSSNDNVPIIQQKYKAY